MAVVLTDTHLGIVMEYAAGGNLTAFVTDKWDTSDQRNGLFCSEDEARFFFKVRHATCMRGRMRHAGPCMAAARARAYA